MALDAYAQRVLSDGATLYLRLDEASGTTVTSKVGGYTGTISGGVTLNQPGGVAGNAAMGFDGTGGIITAAPISMFVPYTMEAWVKATESVGAGSCVIFSTMKEPSLGDAIYVSLEAAASLRVYIENSGGASSDLNPQTTNLGDGRWHHLVLVFYSTTIDAYVDGVLRPSLGTFSVPIVGALQPVEVGRDSKYSAGFKGFLDEVAIYPTALSAAQIAAHYALAAPTYADRVLRDGASLYMRLDETSGTTAYSKVGGYTGTISGGVTLGQPGALADGNTAMLFDGTTGKIETIQTVTLPLSFTVEGWVKISSLGIQRPIFALNYEAPLFSITATGQLLAYDGTWLGGGSQQLLTTGVWYHVVFTVTSSALSIYVNGVLDRTIAITRAAAQTALAGIGYDGAFAPADPRGYWNGLIDEVAIYPTVLTVQTIADHYAARLAVLDTTPAPYSAAIPPPSGPVLSRWLPQPINDGVDTPFSQLWIGGAGTLAAVAGDGTVVTFAGVQAGTRLPIAGRRINSTGTSCTNILSLQAP